MLPVTSSPPPEAQPLKPPDPVTPSGNLTSLKSTFLLRLSPLHRLLLLLLLPSLLLLLLLPSRPSPPPLRLRRHPSPSIPTAHSCPNGHVYVYDLPPYFNYDLISNCHDLNPWTSRCAALSNSGFGVPANLSGVVPTNLLPFWFSTDQFAGEIIFHNRLLSHRCRTLSPSSATAFFVPFYAGLAVGKHLWSSNSSGAARDRECTELISWLKKQPHYTNSGGGGNHFTMIGRITWDFRRSHDGDWGGSFLHMPGMQNITRLLIERNPWDNSDVAVPYPTGFHPKTKHQLSEWQSFVLNRPRPKLFSFAGAARANIRNDFRKILLDECFRAGDACKSVDCSKGKCGNSSRETTSLFLDSEFCLQPRGDSFTRRSMFDCMIAGAIPVIFWKRSAYVQYEWYLPGVEGEEWSVFLDRKEVRRGEVRIKEFLEGIGEERVKRMREKVVRLMPSLIYGGADGIRGGVRDAIDVAVDGVLSRFREQSRRRRR